MFNPPASVLTFQNLIFFHGYTDLEGAAIKNSGNLTVNDVLFQGNYAYQGGAIYNNGTLTINYATFDGNYAYQGGAVYTDGGANSQTVLGSAFINNAADDFGEASITTSGRSRSPTAPSAATQRRMERRS